MKKLTLLLLFLVPVTLSSFGQGDRKPSREKIEQLRIAFLTERLELSVEEAQAFWPLYNEYEAKRNRLHKEMRKEMKSISTQENPTESDVKKMVLNQESYQLEESALRSKYLLGAMKILGPKKTIILETSDEEFKREVMKRLRDK